MSDSEERQFQEIIDQCVSLLRSGTASTEEILARYPDLPPNQQEELSAALWLANSAPYFNPRHEFVQESKVRLLTRIRQERRNRALLHRQSPATLARLISLLSIRHSFKYALALAVIVLFTVSSTGVAYASQSSLPGDFLYPVKLSIEDARLSVSLSPVGDARLRKEFARERLEEIQSLVAAERYDQLSAATENYDRQVSQISRVLGTVSEQNPDLAQQLSSSIAVELKTSAQPLIAVMQSIPPDQRAGIAAIIAALDSGFPPANQGKKNSDTFTDREIPGKSGTHNPGSNSQGNRDQAPPFARSATPFPTGTPSASSSSQTGAGGIQTNTPSPTPTPTSTRTHRLRPTRKPTKTPKPTKTSKPGKNSSINSIPWSAHPGS